MTRSLISMALLVLSIVIVKAAPQPVTSPTEVIRSSNVRVAKIVRPGHRITAADRVAVREILEEVTDFETVSGSVLGPRWDSMPAAERAEFTTEFSRLVSANAVAKMGRHRADRFEYLGETIASDRASVKTRAYYQGKGVSLDYEMARSRGCWRIVNYALNGVSNARSYRRQFDKILEKDTVAGLIVRLRKKADQLEAGGPS